MLAGAVYTIAFAIYAWTAAPGLGWLDSPEFAAAATGLGVAHSPGHPLPALVGKLASLVPVGDLALRVNLAAAVAGAAAAAVVACAARDVIGERSRAGSIAAGSIGLLFALSWAAWAQSVRAEVYALHAALCAGMVWAALRYRRSGATRDLAIAALCAGLALANHHLIAGLAIAPVAVLAVATARSRRPARALGVAALAGLLGVAALLYLPVRSARHPEVDWGAPHTAERFGWTVSARAFQKAALTERVSSRGEDAAQVAAAAVEAASAPLIVLAAFGLALGLRRRGHRGEVAALAAIVALAVAGRAAVGFDPETADHHGYLLPAIAALGLLAALGVRAIAQLARPAAPAALPAIAGLLALTLPAQLALGARASLADARGGDEIARWELEALPPRAVVLSAYFETSFRIAALRALEHSRPDVAVLDRSFLTYPGTADELSRRHPELAPLIAAPLRADRPTPITAVTDVARRRPVLFQLHFNLDAAARAHLIPIGPFALFSPAAVGAEQRAGGERYDGRARAELATRLDAAGHGDAGDARRALLWHDAMRMSFYCAVGRREAAGGALAAAWSLVPGDQTLAEQARSCRLEVPR